MSDYSVLCSAGLFHPSLDYCRRHGLSVSFRWQGGKLVFDSLDDARLFSRSLAISSDCGEALYSLGEAVGVMVRFYSAPETPTLPGIEIVPAHPPKKRGRPPLPEGQKKTRAQIQADYRRRLATKNFEIPGDLYIAAVAALQAAVDCPMLKKDDRQALGDLLRKFGG